MLIIAVVTWPTGKAAAGDEGAGRAANPTVESQTSALADCGGPRIQNGHEIQPTPARDHCLAKQEGIALPRERAPDGVATPNQDGAPGGPDGHPRSDVVGSPTTSF